MPQEDNTRNLPSLISADDFLVLELDDRLEFGAIIIDDSVLTDAGCNGSNCSQNGYKC